MRLKRIIAQMRNCLSRIHYGLGRKWPAYGNTCLCYKINVKILNILMQKMSRKLANHKENIFCFVLCVDNKKKKASLLKEFQETTFGLSSKS